MLRGLGMDVRPQAQVSSTCRVAQISLSTGLPGTEVGMFASRMESFKPTEGSSRLPQITLLFPSPALH